MFETLALDPTVSMVMNIVQIIFWMLPFIIIGYFVLRWATRGLRETIIRFVTLLLPIYIVGIFVVLANPITDYIPYLFIDISPYILYFDPPLLWDIQFQMAIDQGNFIGIVFSTLVILFIILWFTFLIWSSKSMRGTFNKKSKKKNGNDPLLSLNNPNSKKTRIKFAPIAFLIALSIVLLLGLGLPHFNYYIFMGLWLFLTHPIGIITIIVTIITITVIIIFKIIKKKRETFISCEWIDGVEICTERRRDDR